MDLWYDYRKVWGAYPWLLAYAVVVVVALVMAVVGTAMHNAMTILFVPALAGALVHHLLVMKRAKL